ncbi:type I phosphodiesterase / nucleotide pyrophosphatase [Hirsutella rhossiliensis]|uniref:Type I phosphodiesterase / nucleotide pyrophosphatase domain-containing protein n=1 Tax=Hirsutella rhossiliensis TaxID=111463 RepID=A0A9P8MZ47_9HYPO|nr:type I phosphodiesterase / nucleotide pyrophosphatase domain-containing protein [Hirsutella rhossiliensis]KAH0963915.1 type I phosphodiesterase / nucleotide pyrophosphatase domain-containing protein [Hirsutella rhossiliensis]
MSPNILDSSAPDRDNRSLLSPITYDDDASSLHSRSDQDTDSEDDQLQQRARNSRELRAHDRIVLMQEEEMDRLVTSSRREHRRGSGLAVPNPFKMFGRNNSLTNLSAAGSSTEDLAVEKRKARRARRKQKRHRLTRDARHGEDGELMYEMEEGGMKDGSSTGDTTPREDSDEVDRRRLGLVASAKAQRGRGGRRSIFIHLLIATGFSILVLFAWKLSKNQKGTSHAQRLVSNGTALFAPTTIIISLDGFRADFLQRGLTPTLNALIKQGISPKYMLPSFPSVTFPNHYTLATGLYPESHGVVGNTFWDPQLQAEFYYTDPKRSLGPKWWGGEPFWVTAERQGIRTAVHMWPGSEAHILRVEPSFVDKYNGKEKLPNKAARILELLDMPGKEDGLVDLELTRPQLIAAYVPNVDADGHKFGPNTTEIRSTIQEVDDMLDQLCQGLDQRNLTDIVNIIIVSDHGMATTDTSRLIQLEDLVNTSKIEHTDGWPLYGLRPKHDRDLQEMYKEVKEKSRSNPNFDVYLRDVDMPERYHFSNNDRIAPLWIVPKTGWAIVKLDEFDVEQGKKKGLVYHPRGLHGYDHEHPLMRAIFVARGPAFPHPANSRVDPFQNIEVYNILADSVGMEPKPNNGTLRLPLKPAGTHRPEDRPTEPADPPPSPTPQPSDQPQRPVLNEGPEEPDRPTLPPRPSQSAESNMASDSKGNGTSNAEEEKDSGDSGSLKDQAQGALDWVAESVSRIWDKIRGGNAARE